MVGIAAAVMIAGSSPLWSPRVFVEERGLSVALLSVGLAGFCLHSTLLGMLAGANRWTQYGVLMVTDALIRVTIAVPEDKAQWAQTHSDLIAREILAGRSSDRRNGSGDCRPGENQWHRDQPRHEENSE